ncbi:MULTISPECIES: hypothetical protein [unclassified Sinorhizobium]|uniref:hypothetical protein n=1 Tax=unclassified Sinorhizobium TaxID=2613772 RepID=UPI003523F3B9
MKKSSRALAVALHALCAIGLLLLGFAHQVPQAAGANPDYSTAQYKLPDGTYASLCVTVKDDGGKPVYKPNCEACRLTALIILPEPDDEAWLRHSLASLHNPLPSQTAIFGNRSIDRANSRAPPGLA